MPILHIFHQTKCLQFLSPGASSNKFYFFMAKDSLAAYPLALNGLVVYSNPLSLSTSRSISLSGKLFSTANKSWLSFTRNTSSQLLSRANWVQLYAL